MDSLSPNAPSPHLFGLFLGRLFIGLLEPGKEGRGSLADLLGDGNVRVFPARLGTPLLDDLLADKVMVVVELEDLDNLRVNIRVLLGQVSKQTFGSTKQGSFVALGGNDLDNRSARITNEVTSCDCRNLPASAYWRAWGFEQQCRH